MKFQLGKAVPVTAACLSIPASAWLVWKLRNSSGHLRRKQLWHLAIAHLLYCSSSLILYVTWELGQIDADLMKRDRSGYVYRVMLFFAYSFGPKAATLFELHLCSGIFAAFSCSNGQPVNTVRLPNLDSTVIVVWVVSLLLGLLQPRWIHSGVAAYKRMVGRMLHGGYTVELYESVPCIVLCIMFYLACLVRVRDPDGNNQGAWKRLRWYFVTVCLTSLPLILMKLSVDLFERPPNYFVDLAVVTLNMLNGFFTTIVYIYEDRYFGELERATQARRRAALESAQLRHRQDQQEFERQLSEGSACSERVRRVSFITIEDDPGAQRARHIAQPQDGSDVPSSGVFPQESVELRPQADGKSAARSSAHVGLLAF